MSNYNEIQIQHGDFTITIRITDNNTAEPVTEPEIVWMPTPGPVQERTIILNNLQTTEQSTDPEQSTGESEGASGYTRAETVSEESTSQQEDSFDIHQRHIYTCFICGSINQHCTCVRAHCWHCGSRL